MSAPNAIRYIGRKPLLLALLAALLATSLCAQQPTPGSYVRFAASAGSFPLARPGRPAPLLVSSQDWPGVLRAAGDLRADIERVTGRAPRLVRDTVPNGEPVIIGTIGKSPLIDRLVRNGKLDVSRVAGRWETYVIKSIAQPLPGVARALVIAGSDKRGTIYGIYDVSAQIGVSPWYWWADVPPQKHPQLFVLPGAHTAGTPAVKYRGFFINDEAPALSGFTRARFGGFNHQFYEKVFELLLRMKGNYLWPAMWGNAFNDDDKLNPVLADEYGVVMGTSHHEPMLRAQQEWKRYGKGAWNYETNADVLKEFWRQGIKNMGAHESIVTLAMRGDGDMPMSEQSNIQLLERIVRDQRQIIAEVTGKDPSATPQLWALYKEVQDYYDHGMRVPDDVTLLFADDNWGNIRRLPKPGDKPRAGGYGIYYHFDYVGGPRNYKWLNTNQIERVWEQMHLAYRLGVDRIWIVNVGDIKPMEFPLQFWLTYAWNPDAIPAARLPEFTRAWAAQQFGAAHAPAIARILDAYTKYNSRRKPELLAPATYSLANYHEFENVVADYNALAQQAQRIHDALPAEYRAAFYQLVLHPVMASANLNELYLAAAQNQLYAAQGRALTNAKADRVAELFARDARISAFYNDTLAGGKWAHMMDQTHIGYVIWQEPRVNAPPKTVRIELPAAADLGVSVESSDGWWPHETKPAKLPAFDRAANQKRTIDVFNRGSVPFDYSVQASAPWLRVTPAQGRVDQEQRLVVSVDWTRAPVGVQTASITVNGPSGQTVVVQAEINQPASHRYASVEAMHYTRAVASAPVQWLTIPNLGRTASAVTAMPVNASIAKPGGGTPHLEYQLDLLDADSVVVRAYFSPTLDFDGADGLRYAISFDEDPLQLIDMITERKVGDGDRDWERAVSNNSRISESRHVLRKRGAHVLKYWLVDPGAVLQKLVIDWGGVRPSYLGPPEFYAPAAKPTPRKP